jgi:hypothetical protein
MELGRQQHHDDGADQVGGDIGNAQHACSPFWSVYFAWLIAVMKRSNR